MSKRIVGVTVLSSVVGCLAAPHDPNPEPREGETSCIYPATLEITPVNIGQGDATIIATPTKLVLADIGESYWNSHTDALTIDQVLFDKYACRDVDLAVVSHFQVDHLGYVNYGGLWYLVEVLGYTVGETLVRDYLTHVGTTSGTYDNWVTYLGTSQGQTKLNPRTPALGEQIDLGDGIVLTIVNIDTKTASCPGGWGSEPDLSCGGEYASPSEVLGDHRADATAPSENDYSIGFVVSVGDFDMYIGGDTSGENKDSGYGTKYHDVESYLARDVGEVDVLRLNHHGSDHSTNQTFVAELQPQLAVLSVGNANTYGHARQKVIDRLLGVVGGVAQRSLQVYMTERGDDGIGGCLQDYGDSYKAAAELYGQETIVSDNDGDYCTIEGGDVDIVVAADGSTFDVEGIPHTSAQGVVLPCNYDGACDAGEDCLTCPSECALSSGASCGNGVCEISEGEDCLSCEQDCRGKQKGKASNQYCCGDGAGTNPIDCGDSRCSADGFACTNDPVAACCGDGSCEGTEDGNTCGIDCGAEPTCGDGTCDPNEDSCSCSEDCGAAPSSEVAGSTCDDGVDNDCDGNHDCADSDCSADASCVSACDGDGVCESGEDCLSCASDCDGKQNGPPSGRYCCGNGTPESAEGDGSICDDNY